MFLVKSIRLKGKTDPNGSENLFQQNNENDMIFEFIIASLMTTILVISNVNKVLTNVVDSSNMSSNH